MTLDELRNVSFAEVEAAAKQAGWKPVTHKGENGWQGPCPVTGRWACIVYPGYGTPPVLMGCTPCDPVKLGAKRFYEHLEALLTNRAPRPGPPTSNNGAFRCAVTRRHSSVGANPARQLSLQPVAVGADDGGNDIG